MGSFGAARRKAKVREREAWEQEKKDKARKLNERIEEAGNRSKAWTVEQARRLAVRSGEILEAIKRGHLPSDIEGYDSPSRLYRRPPGCPEMDAAIRKIRQAPVRPVYRKGKDWGHYDGR